MLSTTDPDTFLRVLFLALIQTGLTNTEGNHLFGALAEQMPAMAREITVQPACTTHYYLCVTTDFEGISMRIGVCPDLYLCLAGNDVGVPGNQFGNYGCTHR